MWIDGTLSGSKREVWWGWIPLVLATLTATSSCTAPDPTPSGPHPIIIIDVDTLRADHLGCYGYERPTSPNIDAFAAESVFFEWAFSQAPNTPPSQTSILTGLYPSTHGRVDDDDLVPEEVVTLAEALAESGYTTAGFHDGGFMYAGFQIGQGFQLYDGSGNKGLKKVGPKAIRWLRDHAEEDFLLLVHTYDPHAPYAPPAPYDALFIDGLSEPTPGFEPTAEQMERIRRSKYTDTLLTLPPNDLAYAMAQYDGEIRYVDAWFSEFMEVVRSVGLDERATIVFISDHGEEFQEHGSVGHEKLYTTVTRIPFMIRLPGGARARAVPEVVESVDLMPTLLELAGVEVPEGVQGHSLVPLIRDGKSGRLDVAFGESPFFGHRRLVALGDQRMLYTRFSDEVELYDYREDPLERVDVAEQHADRIEVMRNLLAGWEELVTSWSLGKATPDQPLDEETLEQLRALGYVD